VASSTAFATSTPPRRIDPRRRVAYGTALSWESLSMPPIDDRERDSMNQAAADDALELKATVRRNRLLGLWAGELMGLEDQHLEDYAAAIVGLDMALPDDDHVQRKVARDLSGAGLKVTEDQVRGKMDELQAVARGQLQAEE
jgi:hypothetical protein